jgi:hypothetical protein
MNESRVYRIHVNITKRIEKESMRIIHVAENGDEIIDKISPIPKLQVNSKISVVLSNNNLLCLSKRVSSLQHSPPILCSSYTHINYSIKNGGSCV